MQSVDVPARQARAYYRHELSTLTYVTLDAANGGIIRNLNHDGVAVQAVGALRPEQRVRLRFELRFPRVRVEASGQVSWAHSSGRCGIRFVELPASMRRQIDEWIFSNLLDAVALDAAQPHSMFAASVVPTAPRDRARDEHVAQEDAGLTVSSAPLQAIRQDARIAALSEGLLHPHLHPQIHQRLHQHSADDFLDAAVETDTKPNWLARPISVRALSWLVDGLVVTAGVLLFTLIFLSIAHELPPWPLAMGTGFATAGFVATAYWGVFCLFGGASLGVRLAHAASVEEGDSDDAVLVR
jgi:hypothetical protein